MGKRYIPLAGLQREYDETTGALLRIVDSQKATVYTAVGVSATGDATQDTANLQAVINEVATTGPGQVLCYGTFLINATITIPTGVHLLGNGYGDTDTSATQPDEPATEIRWAGSASGTDPMILVKATTASNYVYGAFIDGIYVNGNNAAYDGVVFSSTRYSGHGDLWVARVRHHGMRADDANGVLGAFLRGNRYLYTAGSNAAAASSCGLVLRSSTGAGTTGTHIDDIIVTVVNGNGVEIGDHDNGRFGKVHSSASGTGHGVYLRGLTDSQTREARKNFIGEFSAGDIYAEAGSRNAVDWINSEGTSVTIVSGAALAYKVLDRTNGRRWQTHRYLVDDYRTCPLSDGYAVALGTPSLSTAGGNLGRVLVMADATAEEAWQWTLPPNRNWSGGKIVGVVVRGQKSAAAGTGSVVFKVSGLQRSTPNAIGGGVLATENFTAACDADGTQTIQEHTFTLASAWTIDDQNHFLFRLSRLGTDGSDTLAQTFHVTSVDLIYWADVADSDSNGGYRYQRSADGL